MRVRRRRCAPRRRRSPGRLTASTSALASADDVVGLDQPAGLAVVDDVRGPVGVDGDRAAPRRPSPPRSPGRTARAPTAARARRTRRGCPAARRWSCQPARWTSRAPMRAIASYGCSPSHSPGKPPTITSGARWLKPGPRALVGLDQQRDALDLGEAADVEQHRRVGSSMLGAERSVMPSGPSPRLGEHRRQSARGRERGRMLGVEAVRRRARSGRRRCRAARSARSHRGLGEDDQALRLLAPTSRRRSAHASPYGQRCGSCSIASSISSSVPCRWPTIGTPGATRAAAS